jgi:hypothetical protein
VIGRDVPLTGMMSAHLLRFRWMPRQSSVGTVYVSTHTSRSRPCLSP